jgi:putative intracellular protease/amidase
MNTLLRGLLLALLGLTSGCARQGESKMAEARSTKNALVVMTSHDRLGSTGKPTGWFLSEVTHVYYPLIEAGFEVDFASPRGGAAPLDESSRKLDDPDNARFLADAKLVERIQHTQPLAEVDASKYDVVHFAGGHGVMWDLPGNAEVERIAAGVYERGGIVAAVCHGPAALVDVKLSSGAHLVSGKRVAAFTNAEEQAVGLTEVVPFLLQSKLQERGAKLEPAANWASHALTSERLVTGQNPQSAHAVGRAIVELARAPR